ncbi:MAG: serine/threonine protein phosphatase [Rhodospirillales bacterium]|nr:serine/threonine protein phosphatase [Rhodospirillales bacterium]
MARLIRDVGRRRADPGPVAEYAPRADAGPAPGWLPAGMRVYAIGDVHGCAATLAGLFARIGADLRARPAAAEIVLLGDYIGHGPDSAGVLALLAGDPPVPGARLIALRGDHEQRLLDAMAGSAPDATDFLHEGGAAALASWGIAPGTPPDAWAAHLPPAQRTFLRGLALSHRAGGYLFVHAGLRPGVALARQRRADVLGIREPFLSEPASFGTVVVHGHSVRPAPEIEAGRIGLDTGAGFGGALSCAVLEGETIALWAASTAPPPPPPASPPSTRR